MRNEQHLRPTVKRHIIAQFLLGIIIMAAVTFISIQYDMSATRDTLATTTNYIKMQCNRYVRIGLATETKSLIRVIESSKQVAHMLADEGGLYGDDTLERFARNSYVSSIILLDESGNIVAQYAENGAMTDEVYDTLASPALLNTFSNPKMRYAVRLQCSDKSEIDLAATARQDCPGIVVVYFHTSAEYKNSFNLSVNSLLSGYNTKNDATIVVSSGDVIVSSNDESLIGSCTDDIPILRRLKASSGNDRLLHTRQSEDSFSQYFGLMEQGRDFYVYSFLPDRRVFVNTPRLLLSAFIVYIVILVTVSAVRRRYTQRAQREYTAQLQDKNEQLSLAIEEADRANAAKTSFLSRMSHDIRTPLNGIIGLLEIEAAHPDDIELIKLNREKMRISADHLLSLINDVLQMSKLESGEANLAHEPFNMNRLSMEIVTIVSHRAAEAGITMEHDELSDPVSDLWVYGSPLHLRQIFLNIYSNCIKYNHLGGSISTLFKYVSRSKSSVTCRWIITDTGIGMADEFLSHIFDPFAQEKSDARSIYQGIGLGMTIVKSLVEQMNGSISVSSEEGVGSTFVITIPFDIAEQPEADPAREDAPEQYSISGARLMLAEDNELNAEIAQTLLRDAGSVVTTVANGKEAVELFEQNPPGSFDAILMDVMMPVMDGLTAAKTIRAVDRPDAATIPIIAMTANAFAEDAARCIDAGMNAHLAKPLNIRKTIATIAQCISQDKAQRADK